VGYEQEGDRCCSVYRGIRGQAARFALLGYTRVSWCLQPRCSDSSRIPSETPADSSSHFRPNRLRSGLPVPYWSSQLIGNELTLDLITSTVPGTGTGTDIYLPAPQA